MGWTKSTHFDNWYTGSGIRRQSVIGVCPDQLSEFGNYTHMIKYNSLGSFMGIQWVKKTHYVLGIFNPANGGHFSLDKASNEATWLKCWGDLHTLEGWQDILDGRQPPAPDPSDPVTDPTLTNQTFSSISMIDWRIALAVGIGVLALFYAVIVIKGK